MGPAECIIIWKCKIYLTILTSASVHQSHDVTSYDNFVESKELLTKVVTYCSVIKKFPLGFTLDYWEYFKVSNNRVGWNKCVGWQIHPKLIIVQDRIIVQVGKLLKI